MWTFRIICQIMSNQLNTESNNKPNEGGEDVTVSLLSPGKEHPSAPQSRKASFFIGDKFSKIVGPDEEEIPTEEIIVPPDGGYGWVIVFAAFICNVIVDGIIFSFGSMVKPILESKSDDLNVSEVAFVGSLLSGFYFITGPVASAISNKFGFRPVTVVGSIMAAFGFIISGVWNQHETNLAVLYAFYGIIGGIGFGLVFVPAVIAVGFYFEKKRALATGIAVCGSGLGTFIFAPLIEFLVKKFGWQTSLYIQAGIILLTGLCGLFYKPLKPAKKLDQAPTPFPSPEGTPLLLRIKRARDLEKWDSVASISSGEKFEDLSARAKAEYLYSCARRSSVHSVGAAGVPVPIAFNRSQKRLSVPTMLSSSVENAPLPQPVVIPRNASVKGRSFVGLPDLQEIAEEEHVSDGSSGNVGGSKEKCKQVDDSKNKSNLGLNKVNETEKVKDGMSGKKFMESSTRTAQSSQRPSLTPSTYCDSQIVARIGGSLLAVDDDTQARILRVSTSSRTSLNQPVLRDDIFFTGSLKRIPEYAENVDKVMTSTEWAAAMYNSPSEPTSGLSKDKIVVKTFKKIFSLQVLKKMVSFDLISSPTFAILAISGALSMLAFFTPFIYLSAMAQSSGVEQSKATFLISMIGISNTVGRIICGWLADRPQINALWINNFALTIGGIATALIPLFSSYYAFAGYTVIFGLSLASFASLRSIIIVELLGLSNLTNAFGLLLLFQGIFAFIGSPLAGFLYDTTGSYTWSFLVAGGFLLLAALVHYPAKMVNDWERKRLRDKSSISIS